MTQAVQQQLLLQSAVAKHMSSLLDILLAHVQDSTVHTALISLAGGLEPFKAEGDPHKAMAALANFGAFIQSMVPFLNQLLNGLPVAATDATQLPLICNLLTKAIKTFKSAVEVCMRELGREQDNCAALSRSVTSYSQLLATVSHLDSVT